MMHPNTEPGIKIVGLLANAAAVEGATFTNVELAKLLTQFKHFTSEKGEYTAPHALVKAAIEKFRKDGQEQTAKDIEAAFMANPNIDPSMFR
jgi:hypothetical protein